VRPKSDDNLHLEIGHVLFIDIVGYSRLLIEEQKERLNQLTEIVLATAPVRDATDEQLVRLPTGDGMALVFHHSAEEPARCALEVAEALQKHPELPVRMGIHSGPVSEVTDVSGRSNIAGAGINMAQRVMDCGDAGHILMSQHVADDLVQYRQWAPRLHDLGDCEVKHGVRLHLVNVYAEPLGNAALPQKFQQSTSKPSAAKSARHSIAWAAAVLLLALVAGALFFFMRKTPAPPVAATAAEKSIAVLPFENLSSDKDNAYFADGIQDEILTRLSKIAALKVISRTSTQKYKSAPDNLREVGKQLGVANLLEGSVQKIANAVHVNVQLIRASNDEHLWAESYNRKLDDVFAVEGEVATAIADQLNAKLTGGEKAILTTKPTTNPQAYDDYLRGLTQSRHFSKPSLEAADSFAKAVREDPQFALGWATLSRMDALNYFKALDRSPARREAARQALAEAVRLQPELLETQMARAYFQYWVLLDYRGARDMLEQLRAKWPGNSEIVKVLGWISARLGDWQRCADYLDQAIELDPRDLFLRSTATGDRLNNRDPSAALRITDEALQIEPEDGHLLALKAQIFQSLGRLDQAQTIIERLNPDDPNQLSTIVYQAKLRRKPASALHYFQSIANESATQPAQLANLLTLADLLNSAGDQPKARAIDGQVRVAAEAALKEQPNNPYLLLCRATALAGLGDRAAALEGFDRCIALEAEDALEKGSIEENKARALARFGGNDEAIALLQHLLSISYNSPVTPALLRLDPDWDNLRGDPRFQKLCEGK